MIKGTAVVIGVGAQIGLGAALCRRFASEGLHVLIAGRTPSKLEQVVTSILAANGSAESVAMDTTNETDVVKLFDRAMAPASSGEAADLIWLSGIHVAHVVIDGGIDGERLRSRRPEAVRERGEDGLLNVDAIAETYWQIHRQARSAWTHEIDLRPFKEPF